MPKVCVTFFEDPIEVPDDELDVLRHQGLLVEGESLANADKPAKSAASATRKE